MKSRFYLGFFAAIILVLIVGVKSYITFKQQNAETLKVKQSYKLLNQMQTIQLLLIDMETGRRGFRSTNQLRFLKPYVSAVRGIHPQIAKLKEMSVHTEVKSRIPKLEKHIDELLNFWNRVGVDASSFSKEEVAQLMDREKEQMDIIRKEITAITDIEKASLTLTEIHNNRVGQLCYQSPCHQRVADTVYRDRA